MGMFETFGWGREPIEDLESEREMFDERDQTYRDSADELRGALGYRDQLLMEQDEKIEELQGEIYGLQDELSEATLALTVARTEKEHKAAKLAEALKTADEANAAFRKQQTIIATQESTIAELSEKVNASQEESLKWKRVAKAERERAVKLTEVIAELVRSMKTGRALPSDFSAKLEAAGLRVKSPKR